MTAFAYHLPVITISTTAPTRHLAETLQGSAAKKLAGAPFLHKKNSLHLHLMQHAFFAPCLKLLRRKIDVSTTFNTMKICSNLGKLAFLQLYLKFCNIFKPSEKHPPKSNAIFFFLIRVINEWRTAIPKSFLAYENNRSGH